MNKENTRIEAIKQHAEPYEEFLPSLFSKSGYTHVFLGESHRNGTFHNAVSSRLSVLKQQSKLSYLCLELEHTSQGAIDAFLATGDEKFLYEIYTAQERVNRQSQQDRVDSGYYHILESARTAGLEVVAMDLHKGRLNRDRFMAEHIPPEGRVLIYVGAFHMFLPFGLTSTVSRLIDRDVMRVLQNTTEKQTGPLPFLRYIASVGQQLKSLPGFGVNLKDNGLLEKFKNYDADQFCDAIWFHNPLI